MAKKKKRFHSVEYKLSIIERLNKCKSGEIQKLLDNEGLSASLVYKWRKAHKEGKLDDSTPGRKAKPVMVVKNNGASIEELKRKNEILEAKLESSKMLIGDILETFWRI